MITLAFITISLCISCYLLGREHAQSEARRLIAAYFTEEEINLAKQRAWEARRSSG